MHQQTKHQLQVCQASGDCVASKNSKRSLAALCILVFIVSCASLITPQVKATATQTHTVSYSTLSGSGYPSNNWGISVDSDYALVITNSLTISSGGDLPITAEVDGSILLWMVVFTSSTYIASIEDGNGYLDGSLNSNGTIEIISQGDTVTFVTADGSLSGVTTTLENGYPSNIHTENDGGNTITGGELSMTLNAYTSPSPSPSPTPSPTPSTSPTPSASPSPTPSVFFNANSNAFKEFSRFSFFRCNSN